MPYRKAPTRRYVVGEILNMPEWHGPKFVLTLVPYKILSVRGLPIWHGREHVLLGLLSPTGRETDAIVDGPNDFVGAKKPIL